MRAKLSIFTTNGLELTTTVQDFTNLQELYGRIAQTGMFLNDELFVAGGMILAIFVKERLGSVSLEGKQ